MKEYHKPTDKELLEQSVQEKEKLIMQGVTNIEFDPEEADLLGVFKEDALNEEDALEAALDY